MGGFAWGQFTLVIRAPFHPIYTWIRNAHLVSLRCFGNLFRTLRFRLPNLSEWGRFGPRFSTQIGSYKENILAFSASAVRFEKKTLTVFWKIIPAISTSKCTCLSFTHLNLGCYPPYLLLLLLLLLLLSLLFPRPLPCHPPPNTPSPAEVKRIHPNVVRDARSDHPTRTSTGSLEEPPKSEPANLLLQTLENLNNMVLLVMKKQERFNNTV